jgi:hypothetical protein
MGASAMPLATSFILNIVSYGEPGRMAGLLPKLEEAWLKMRSLTCRIHKSRCESPT